MNRPPQFKTKDFEAEPGWRCRNCRYVGEKYGQSANCSECGAKETEETDLREEMIRLAEKSGCRVEVVNHSDRLMQLQGIGALLRYYAFTHLNNTIRKPRKL